MASTSLDSCCRWLLLSSTVPKCLLSRSCFYYCHFFLLRWKKKIIIFLAHMNKNVIFLGVLKIGLCLLFINWVLLFALKFLQSTSFLDFIIWLLSISAPLSCFWNLIMIHLFSLIIFLVVKCCSFFVFSCFLYVNMTLNCETECWLFVYWSCPLSLWWSFLKVVFQQKYHQVLIFFWVENGPNAVAAAYTKCFLRYLVLWLSN